MCKPGHEVSIPSSSPTSNGNIHNVDTNPAAHECDDYIKPPHSPYKVKKPFSANVISSVDNKDGNIDERGASHRKGTSVETSDRVIEEGCPFLRIADIFADYQQAEESE